MLTILLFIVILSLLVWVHEMGHFLIARLYGVKAEEFGFGFPPRIGGVYYDEQLGRYRFLLGGRAVETKNTVFSLNWLPLGGFVRIKGEEGESHERDSFSAQVAWKRILILAAGVLMNVLAAWVLFSFVFGLGIRQPITPEERALYHDAAVQILEIEPSSPAALMGLQPGDIIASVDGRTMKSTEETKGTIDSKAGTPLTLTIERFGKEKTLTGTPRTGVSPDQGALGIALSDTAVVKLDFLSSVSKGLTTTLHVLWLIVSAFGALFASLFTGTHVSGVDLTGPVGIVYLTKQVSALGLVYILQFAALLSINLAIINILPIPALDGGRILFILIEKIKGSPVRQKTEGLIHQIGFLLLIFLMIFITTRDVLKFDIFGKILHLF